MGWVFWTLLLGSQKNPWKILPETNSKSPWKSMVGFDEYFPFGAISVYFQGNFATVRFIYRWLYFIFPPLSPGWKLPCHLVHWDIWNHPSLRRRRLVGWNAARAGSFVYIGWMAITHPGCNRGKWWFWSNSTNLVSTPPPSNRGKWSFGWDFLLKIEMILVVTITSWGLGVRSKVSVFQRMMFFFQKYIHLSEAFLCWCSFV